GAALAAPVTAVASGGGHGAPDGDLAVSVRPVPRVVPAGTASVTWTVVVENEGWRPLADVQVDAPGLALGPPVPDGGCDDGDGKEDPGCAPGVLGPGEAWTYTAAQDVARPADCGRLAVTATATAIPVRRRGHMRHGGAPVTDSATAAAFVRCPDLTVVKRAAKDGYANGETVTWIVTVTNSGNVPVTPPVLTDPGVTFAAPVSDAPMSSFSRKRVTRRTAKPAPKRATSLDPACAATSPQPAAEDCDDGDAPGACEEQRAMSRARAHGIVRRCAPPVLAPGETLTYTGTQAGVACGTVTNTVTVTASPAWRVRRHRPAPAEQPLTRSATGETFVSCPATVTTTATLAYTRAYAWGVTKQTPVASPITVPATDTATTAVTVPYAIAVTKTVGADSNVAVAGGVTVSNPYPVPLNVTISDDLVGVAGETCRVDPAAEIPASGSRVFTYSCALASVPAAGTARNVATASFQVDGVAVSVSGGADVVDNGPTARVSDTVTVIDVVDGAPEVLGTTSASQSFAKDRRYPVPAAGCDTHVNTARVEGSSLLQPVAGLPVVTPPVVVQVCREAPPTPAAPAAPAGGPAPTSSGAVTGAGTGRVAPRARLVVAKSGPVAAVAGQVVRYTITVRNTGRAAARGVVLRDVLPRGLSLAARARGATVSRGTVRWKVGTLAAGGSRTVRVTLRIGRSISGRRCNVATATASNAAGARGTRCTRIAAIAGALQPAVTE
ncbi:MAG: DUF11 domain-containing protein, partial [Actinomycetota bacterium]